MTRSTLKWTLPIQSKKIKTQGTTIIIGSFDGVHLGHQALLNKAIQHAKKHDRLSLALIIYPHPSHILSSNKNNHRPMQTPHERATSLKEYGIDEVACLTFNHTLASFSANRFIHEVLMDACSIKHWILGHDSRFGYNREGDLFWLESHQSEYPFTFESLPATKDNQGNIISSSLLRHSLLKRDLQSYLNLSGRPLCYRGTVIKGAQRGRLLGFPTANLPLNIKTLYPTGVFTASVKIAGSTSLYPAVVNMGRRPTFSDDAALLEAYLIEKNIDLYGKELKVSLLEFLRPSTAFDHIDALKQAIKQDVYNAQLLFKKNPL
jgi:riboflavin kinase / FMN adenylyltransferase